MHIPKASNIRNRFNYILSKSIGNDKKYFISREEKLLNEMIKIFNHIPKDQFIIFNEMDNDFDIDTDNNFDNKDAFNLLYLAPKNYPLCKWLLKLKIAKYYFNLEGVPYNSISNYGKMKIHLMAHQYYLKELDTKKEADEILKEATKDVFLPKLKKLEKLVIPTHLPK